MRKDMAKVIVERPRAGSRSPNRNDRQRDRRVRSGQGDDLPKFMSHKALKSETEFGVGKHLNENLQPLRRFLHKNVGRPWSKVYAEVREHLRVTNPTQLHVMQHLTGADDTFALVRFDVIEVDGKVCRGPGVSQYDPWEFRQGEFYVHPRTGLLCEGDTRPRWRGAWLPGNWVQHEGVWYEVERGEVWRDTVHSLKGPEFARLPVDALTGKTVSPPDPAVIESQYYVKRVRRLTDHELDRFNRRLEARKRDQQGS